MKPTEQPKGGMGSVDLAVIAATTAHARQVGKNGQPYILHSLRVMTQMNTEVERQVAVLHDVLKETKWTEESLRGIFDDAVVDSVVFLTRDQGENYFDYIRRVGQDPLTRKVKLADLWDNLRFGCSSPERYIKAIDMLSEGQQVMVLGSVYVRERMRDMGDALGLDTRSVWVMEDPDFKGQVFK